MKKVFFVLFLSLLYACGGGGGGNTSSHYWTQFEADDFLIFDETTDSIAWSHDNRGQAPSVSSSNLFDVQKVLSDEDFCTALNGFDWSTSFNDNPCDVSNQVMIKGYRYPLVSCSWIGGFDDSFWADPWTTVEEMLDPAFAGNLDYGYCDFFRIDSGAYYYGGWQNGDGSASNGFGTTGCQVVEAGGLFMFDDNVRPGSDAWVMNWDEEDFNGGSSGCDSNIAATLSPEGEFKWFTDPGNSFGSIQILEVGIALSIDGSSMGDDCLTLTREYGFIDFSEITGCVPIN